MDPLSETQRVLETARAVSSKALVAYSDGKDARVVMDLAVRTFDHVEGFFMYYVPGITHLENAVDAAEHRLGIHIHRVPHWSSLMAIKNGVYCNPWWEAETMPKLSLWNIYAFMIKLTGIPIILTGMKRSDSNSRRRLLAWTAANTQIIHPIAGWRKRDVLGYLHLHGITVPGSSGAATTGVDLSDRELFWLHDTHPEDFKALMRYFPFIQAVIKRRSLYGT